MTGTITDYVDEEKEVIPFKYSISTYGADYDVQGLIRRISNGDIIIPLFQRGYVWTYPQACRFIESLLLGLPVPNIFFSKEKDTNKLLVIDGSQRLRTLEYFYKGIFEPTNRAFSLQNVQEKYNELTYDKLSHEDRRRLDDSIIHAIVVKQEHPSEDDSSIYLIFERINTGGLKLQPQEIRACIYHGPFNELIKQLNDNRDWRNLYGSSDNRMKDQEMILRFFALYYNHEQYKKPLVKFLNSFMDRNNKLQFIPEKELSSKFELTTNAILASIGKDAFKLRGRRNAAFIEAIMVGVAKRLDKGAIVNSKELADSHSILMNELDSLGASNSDDKNVQTRMKKAIDTFSSVK